MRKIFSGIVYDVTIDRFEGEFIEWYMEFTVSIDTFIKSIVKAYNGMPRQLKPWALLFIDMMNIQVDVEGNIKNVQFPSTEYVVGRYLYNAYYEESDVDAIVVTPHGKPYTVYKIYRLIMKGDKIRKVVPLE